MHSSPIFHARILPDLYPSLKILARLVSILKDSCNILKQSGKNLARFLNLHLPLSWIPDYYSLLNAKFLGLAKSKLKGGISSQLTATLSNPSPLSYEKQVKTTRQLVKQRKLALATNFFKISSVS